MNDDIFKIIDGSLAAMDNPADLIAKVKNLKEKINDQSMPVENQITETISLLQLMINYAVESQNQLGQSLYKARYCLNYHRDI